MCFNFREIKKFLFLKNVFNKYRSDRYEWYINQKVSQKLKRIAYKDLKKSVGLGERAVKVYKLKFRKIYLLGLLGIRWSGWGYKN